MIGTCLSPRESLPRGLNRSRTSSRSRRISEIADNENKGPVLIRVMVSSGFQEGATHPIGFKPDLRANRDREQGLRQAQDGLAQLKLPIMIELRQGLRIKLDRDS